jgi:hypothetical protein
VPEASIVNLQAAFRVLFRGGAPRVAALRDVPREDPYVAALLDALLEAKAEPCPRG